MYAIRSYYEKSIQNVLFYLATPPESYEVIIELLGKSKLNHFTKGWTRIVVEKPYGSDLETAEELEQLIHNVFNESQIYRIDHYLGKETVQNILVLRVITSYSIHYTKLYDSTSWMPGPRSRASSSMPVWPSPFWMARSSISPLPA